MYLSKYIIYSINFLYEKKSLCELGPEIIRIMTDLNAQRTLRYTCTYTSLSKMFSHQQQELRVKLTIYRCSSHIKNGS